MSDGNVVQNAYVVYDLANPADNSTLDDPHSIHPIHQVTWTLYSNSHRRLHRTPGARVEQQQTT